MNKKGEKMKKILSIIFILYLVSFSYGQTIQEDLDQINKQIKEAEVESAKYAGGLIKTLIESRIQILNYTKAMLEQRIAAKDYNVVLNYTLDGKAFHSPENKDEMLNEIEREAIQALKEKESLKAEADKYSGGLIRATKLSTVAMKDQQLALLELKRISLLYEIPIFWSSTDQPSKEAESPKVSTSSEDDISKLITLRIISKRVFEANYSEHLGMEFTYTNNSQKTIKAFTGVMNFKDVFDKEILPVNLTVDDFIIKPGQTVTDKKKSLELNKFNDAHNRLKTINLDSLKLDFEVTGILFSDGTRIGK
jgi:hypothetical protein